ncbi:MAG: HigA family addiction module antitoxin [Terrimicrobiaceae bacterium]
MKTILPLVTPGEILREEFLVPLGLSAYRVAKDIGVSPTAIGQILVGERAVTPDMALRLGCYFGMSAEFWLNAQSHHDLRKLERAVPARPKIKLCAAMKVHATRPLIAA